MSAVRRIEPADLPAFATWMACRGLPLPTDLPRLGWRTGHAAAWLLHDGGPLAVLEPLISRPGTPGEEVDGLVRRVADEARALGARRLIAHARLPVVIARAIRLGWKQSAAEVALTLDLKNVEEPCQTQ